MENEPSRTKAIGEVLLQAADIAGATHTELLSALMTLYVAVAKAHPCCIESAEHALGLAACRIRLHRQGQADADAALPSTTHAAPSHLQ